MLNLRRRDLLDAEGDASDLNWPVAELIARLAQSLYGAAGERERERVLRALVDLPYAAVRRHRQPPALARRRRRSRRPHPPQKPKRDCPLY